MSASLITHAREGLTGNTPLLHPAPSSPHNIPPALAFETRKPFAPSPHSSNHQRFFTLLEQAMRTRIPIKLLPLHDLLITTENKSSIVAGQPKRNCTSFNQRFFSLHPQLLVPPYPRVFCASGYFLMSARLPGDPTSRVSLLHNYSSECSVSSFDTGGPCYEAGEARMLSVIT